ncbi:MAG: hypothetical protein JWM22_2580 [Frankiales bacterium]|nr:hypothetical protein [Frankiales bacterium]
MLLRPKAGETREQFTERVRAAMVKAGVLPAAPDGEKPPS